MFEIPEDELKDDVKETKEETSINKPLIVIGGVAATIVVGFGVKKMLEKRREAKRREMESQIEAVIIGMMMREQNRRKVN